MKVTIGRYTPGNSLVHKMNPILKIITNVILIVLVFLSKSFILSGTILAIIVMGYIVSGLRPKQLINVFFTVSFIGIFIFIINIFLIKTGYSENINGGVDYDAQGDGYFWKDIKWRVFHITDRGIFQTLIIMLRIYIMIILTTMLTATTKPKALTRSIEILLYPLKLLFVPIHVIAMIISIALRFVPTLLDEAQRIMKAQASRGVDFKNGNLKTKAKSMVTLIIPLFVSAFAKADDLANAMETRGYSPYEKRTRYRSYPITFKDVLICLISAALISLIILYRLDFGIFEHASWWV